MDGKVARLTVLASLAERGHMGIMKKVTCECGAIYERTEEKRIFRDKDRFACYLCGRVLESWSASHARFPIFRLVKRPETDTD